MRVDVHTHFLPEQYRQKLRDLDKSIRIEEDDGVPHVVYSDRTRSLAPGFYDLDARKEWMDEFDIDLTVASISNPNPLEDAFTVDESTELVRAINDGFADVQDERPDEFAGLGELPFRDPEAAVEEVDRIAEDLDLAGIGVSTTVLGKKLSAPEFEPIFDRIDHHDLPVFVHPGHNVMSDQLEDEEGGLNPTVIFPTETAVQITRLIWDGFFDRHDFDLLIAHMGGVLPYLVGRLERGRERFRLEDGVPPERPFIEYIQDFYYDAISFHQPAVQMAVETVGVDHMMFGTDYPFDMEVASETLADIDETAGTEAEKQAILGDNAVDFFDL